MAQLVEQRSRKAQVTGSNPVVGSTNVRGPGSNVRPAFFFPKSLPNKKRGTGSHAFLSHKAGVALSRSLAAGTFPRSLALGDPPLFRSQLVAHEGVRGFLGRIVERGQLNQQLPGSLGVALKRTS